MCSNWVPPSGGFSLNAGPVSVGKRACIYVIWSIVFFGYVLNLTKSLCCVKALRIIFSKKIRNINCMDFFVKTFQIIIYSKQ